LTYNTPFLLFPNDRVQWRQWWLAWLLE